MAGSQVYLVARYDRARLLPPSGELERLRGGLSARPWVCFRDEIRAGGRPGFAASFRLVASGAPSRYSTLSTCSAGPCSISSSATPTHMPKISPSFIAPAQSGWPPLRPFEHAAVYPRINNKFAMKMGGQKDPRYLTPQHIAAFAVEAGVGIRAVRAQLLELCEKVLEQAPPLAEGLRKVSGCGHHHRHHARRGTAGAKGRGHC